MNISTKIKPIFIFLLLNYITVAYSFAQDPVSIKTQITAKSIIDKYIETTGGADSFAKIEDRTIYFSGTSLGQNITVTIMQKSPDKLFQEVVAGEVHQKKYFDGKNGVLILGNNKIEIDETELESLQIDAALDFLLNSQKYNVEVKYDGKEMCDSSECYKLKMILPSGNIWFQYFDATTGFRIKETKEIQTPTGNYNQTTYYNNYGEIEGLKFPFEIRQILGAQKTVLNIDSLKINSGLPDSLFKIPDL